MHYVNSAVHIHVLSSEYISISLKSKLKIPYAIFEEVCLGQLNYIYFITWNILPSSILCYNQLCFDYFKNKGP